MMRNRGSPKMLVLVAAVAIFAISLLGFTAQNDRTTTPSPGTIVNDTTNDAHSTNTQSAAGMPSIDPTYLGAAKEQGAANAITTKAASNTNGVLALCIEPVPAYTADDQTCNRFIHSPTALLMRPTEMYFGRTNDGRRSNVPPMNNALAAGWLIAPTTAMASVLMNC